MGYPTKYVRLSVNFVAGVGTGGTVTGVGEYLKGQNTGIQVVAVEPKSSAMLSTGISCAHKIQGIGAGFVPSVLNTAVYDEIIPVENEDAFAVGKLTAKKKACLSAYPRVQRFGRQSSLQSDPKIKARTLLFCSRIPETDIFLHRCLRTKEEK